MPKLLENTTIIIDFDSTIVKTEGLDELADIAMANHPQRNELVQRIRAITEQGMNGEISFAEGLQKRIQLLQAHKSHIDLLIQRLSGQISDSFVRNKAFLQEYADQILVISSGFREYIEPVVSTLGIAPNQVIANTFKFDPKGNVVGVEAGPLAQDGGKIKVVSTLGLQGDIFVIGDGYTDYQIRESGLATQFYAFTENVARSKVIAVADVITPSLDEFLFIHNLPRSHSYPRNRIKVLLLENVHPVAVQLFKQSGYQVETVKRALDENELIEKLRDVSILGIRSKTEITARVIENAPKLQVIGAFCIGTNQIDLTACTKRGIAVFNAPYSNTRSVVELAIGEMIMLIRGIFQKSTALHAGIWDKSAANSHEIRGKKLGIVGYGHIGTQLSIIGEAMGMEVYFYDIADKMPIGNARKLRSLDELVRVADIVSLHIDGRASNNNLFGAAQFEKMKDGAIFLNLARGHLVDISALVRTLKSGKLGGAAIDVFPYEPKANDEAFMSELCGMPNVILTPHIGGSTEEAQEGIGNYVPDRLLDYMNNGSSTGSVNFPAVQLPVLTDAHRLLHIHHNVPGILAKLNNLFAKYQINVSGQYLKTNELIGYVIVDLDKNYTDAFIEEIRGIDETIKFRLLY
jgi:D-3-phosphoglycerate dehydrogenase